MSITTRQIDGLVKLTLTVFETYKVERPSVVAVVDTARKCAPVLFNVAESVDAVNAAVPKIMAHYTAKPEA